MFKKLPSYVGDYKSRDNVRRVPTQYKPTTEVLDTANLQALLSAPVRVSLPLANVLKVRPELWHEVVKCLKKMGIEMPLVQELKETMVIDPTKKVKCEPVPLNKVGDYCEGDDGNTTLPVEFNRVKSLVILDSGAGVAIATKQVWESWGKPALRKTRMKLQLADGFMESPIGLLEKIIVTSCGIEYEHTFVVVDFGKKPNYEIILGGPFMRQLKMI